MSISLSGTRTRRDRSQGSGRGGDPRTLKDRSQEPGRAEIALRDPDARDTRTLRDRSQEP